MPIGRELGRLGDLPDISRLVSGGTLPVYLMRDVFITDRAAGAVNGTVAEPGPGTRTVVDGNNTVSTSSGALVVSGTPALFDRIVYGTQTLATGLCFLVHQASGTEASNGEYIGVVQSNGTAIYVFQQDYILDGISGAGPNAGSPYSGDVTYAVVCQDAGSLYLTKASGVWTLQYVTYGTRPATGTVGYVMREVAHTVSFSAMKICQLPAPWSIGYGIATQRLAGARSLGNTFTHEADCLIEWTQTTVPSSDYTLIDFRQQDNTHKWQAGVMADGSIILQEWDGTPTSRGSTDAGVVSNGHRIFVVASGTTIKIYSNDALRITYSSASKWSSATSGDINAIGAGGAVSDIVAWPRTISNQALGILNRI